MIFLFSQKNTGEKKNLGKRQRKEYYGLPSPPRIIWEKGEALLTRIDMDLIEAPLKFRMSQRGSWTCTGPD